MIIYYDIYITDVPNARKSGKRFGLSNRGITHVINALLEDLDMDHLYISKTAVEKWNLQDGNNSLERYEKESEGVTCVKFDGAAKPLFCLKDRVPMLHMLPKPNHCSRLGAPW